VEQDECLEPVKGDRHWRTKSRPILIPAFLRGLAAELRSDMAADVRQRWQELRALETVWAELAGDFDGVNPVTPELRAFCDDTKARLKVLASELGVKRLPEPEAAQLTALREEADRSFRQLGQTGVYE
jgi:hypothetical protein